MTTRYFYDCEFIENGSTIELISIGIVASDGRELYAVAEEIEREPLYDRITKDRWLMEHVVPHLPLRPGSQTDGPNAQYGGHFSLNSESNTIMPRRMLRNAVRDFLLAEGPDIELWADYGAYDHVVLCQLFGRMINLPEGLPMFTHDFQQELRRLGSPPLPEQPYALHNALADARHLKACFDAVMDR